MNSAQRHIPVMLEEVLRYLQPRNGETYVDATFGNGGYSRALLDSADCRVIAIDRDPTVQSRAEEFKKIYGDRFDFVAGRFGNLENLIDESVDGFVFDIGVSSMQLDDAERGFSFSKPAPLDMRMSCSGLTAAELVNTLPEKELADLIYAWGEERKSRQIASAITAFRQVKPIETTTELAGIIRGVVHKTFGGIDPATRTFQALRIAVNQELTELSLGLEAAAKKLRSGGRIVVVDFHSLEDRIVKNFFNELAGKQAGVSRYQPPRLSQMPVLFEAHKAVMPSAKECAANPRARSAKLRWALKTKEGTTDD